MDPSSSCIESKWKASLMAKSPVRSAAAAAHRSAWSHTGRNRGLHRRWYRAATRRTHDGRPVEKPALTSGGVRQRADCQISLLSRLRNSWGWRLGAVLNSPGKHPFALDRRLDAGSGGPAARREVEVGLFRRVADRASEHRWVTDAGRAPRGVAGGALVMSPGVRAGRR